MADQYGNGEPELHPTDELEFYEQELEGFPEESVTIFINKRTGKSQRCRLETDVWDDPMMIESGCAGEFANEWRKKDLHDGCPRCSGEVEDNLSEPDVLARWDLR